MKKQELVEKLENTQLPQIEMAGHRRQLKMALLESDYLRKGQEVTFMESVRARVVGTYDTVIGGLVTQQPVWKVVLATLFIVAVVVTTIFAGYSVGPQKASPFPGGSMEVGGTQLTAEQKEMALTILNADTGVQELLHRGAIIEPELILPLEVVMTKIDSQTGEIEEITETWAQAWIYVGDSIWSAKVDLVNGIVVSLSE